MNKPGHYLGGFAAGTATGLALGLGPLALAGGLIGVATSASDCGPDIDQKQWWKALDRIVPDELLGNGGPMQHRGITHSPWIALALSLGWGVLYAVRSGSLVGILAWSAVTVGVFLYADSEVKARKQSAQAASAAAARARGTVTGRVLTRRRPGNVGVLSQLNGRRPTRRRTPARAWWEMLRAGSLLGFLAGISTVIAAVGVSLLAGWWSHLALDWLVGKGDVKRDPEGNPILDAQGRVQPTRGAGIPFGLWTNHHGCGCRNGGLVETAWTWALAPCLILFETFIALQGAPL